ncbi:MAG: D-beta-D-heptose 1-phosphate adenosyltransferase [Bacteroidetes bacterium GWF2_43_63]|nr:MAG: D-beta-D-heptose 1-phosphate adenosyltransferase [Bacteroidetes bacterium GWE2_42_42]OFY53319.1 MAG: D-beta-D-heptose 1-phosphate adenosyltransferase [Bacteroidetes bacterium GWF2_43_63]HBG71685.1 D-glycero-beta-D-manno-heptose 1-phosphate adenylyltransferase [Bacteroidales bacterium]HCB61650.1 D-glycero-beta-D-manno-heptose 1-phosphate adenylyltransferase [Bacteroidales bacterium]HCY22862.1 D-glycero-beta-D-manno-heptose 1-phosphate adenylyltransferase [Bacteroidales bacterium]
MDFRKLISEKVMTREQLIQRANTWRTERQTIVFSNGCFDIIHPGHALYLAAAAALGSRLVLGVNTDDSVKRLKGASRPIISENERCLLLASFQFVDAVCLFDEDTPLQLIESIIPDILVKGKDYTIDQIVGADVVLQHGGKVETIELVEGFSTSSLIEKIKRI